MKFMISLNDEEEAHLMNALEFTIENLRDEIQEEIKVLVVTREDSTNHQLHEEDQEYLEESIDYLNGLKSVVKKMWPNHSYGQSC